MKQVIRRGWVVALMPFALAAGNTVAEEASGFTLSPWVGYHMYDNSLNYEDSETWGLGFGYQTSSPWAVELTFLQGTTESDDTGAGLDLDQMYLSGLYHFTNHDGVTPYLSFGLGTQTLAYEEFSGEFNDTILVGGAGLKFPLSDAWSFRSEIRAINNLDVEMTDFAVGVGLRWLVGASSGSTTSAEEPVSRTPKIVDEDGDGVADSADRCLETPAGATVDNYGCEVIADADGDGVPDEKDECKNTSRGAKVDSKGCYLMLTETIEIQLSVAFELNSDVVSPSSFPQIEEVVEFMIQYPQTDVVLEGHTDDRGAAEYNKTLSQQRADAVAGVMRERYGVAPSRIKTKGFGESEPLYSNDTAEGRAKNRRVTAKVSAQVETIQR